MSAILTVNQSWTDGKRLHIVGTIVLTGNYVMGGIPLSLLVDQIFTSQPLVHSDVVGKGGYYGYDIGTLYEYRYQGAPQSSNAPGQVNQFLAQGVLRIFLNGTEIAASALPAGVLSDTIKFYGIATKY